MFTIREIMGMILFLAGMMGAFFGLQGIMGRRRWGLPVLLSAALSMVALVFMGF